jgi:hypothetical protein
MLTRPAANHDWLPVMSSVNCHQVDTRPVTHSSDTPRRRDNPVLTKRTTVGNANNYISYAGGGHAAVQHTDLTGLAFVQRYASGRQAASCCNTWVKQNML